MMAMAMSWVGENGPELLVGNCMPIQTGTQNLGDLFIDNASGTMLAWNGTAWDEIGPFSNSQMEAASEFAQALLTGKAMYISLHTADPGDTGANEVVGGGYRRRMYAVGGVQFDNLSKVTVTHVGIWSTMYGGGFYRGTILDSSKTIWPEDTLNVPLSLIDEAGPRKIRDSGAALYQAGMTKYFGARLPSNRPCPHCGTLNPPDARECGEGRWNGCGAPLRKQ